MSYAASRSLDPFERPVPLSAPSRSLDPFEAPIPLSTNNNISVDPYYSRALPVAVGNTFDEKTVSPSTITNKMIRNGSIDNGKIAEPAINTDNIYSGAITSAKLSNFLIKYDYKYFTPAQMAALTSTPQTLFFGVPVMFAVVHGNPGTVYPGGSPSAYGSVGATDKIRIRSSDTISSYVTWGELNMVGFLDGIDKAAMIYPPAGGHLPVQTNPLIWEVFNPGDGITAGSEGVVFNYWYIVSTKNEDDVT